MRNLNITVAGTGGYGGLPGTALRARRSQSGEGRVPPLHAQGNPRTARRHSEYAGRHPEREDHVLTAILGLEAETRLKDLQNIHIVACGTSCHAGLVARYWVEDQAGLPCQVEVASEYRYRQVAVPANTLLIAI